MIERIRDVIVPTIHPEPLALEDAETIAAIGQIVVDIDGKNEREELATFFAISKLLFELAGKPDADIPTFATDEDDEERMFELATSLKPTPARELTFVVARALAGADHEVAESEDTFLDRLRSVLAIEKWRADELTLLLRS